MPREAPRLLEMIRTLELPLVMHVQPRPGDDAAAGVSKATGLHAALDMLRLSPRNTLAIGDAENDHELLRLAEVGVAVEWGSPALQAAADVVFRARAGRRWPAICSSIAASGSLPDAPRGSAPTAAWPLPKMDGEFSLAVRGRNVLVAGDAKSGKSWLAGLLCEQLILHGYCVCVIDPEGDYRSLEALARRDRPRRRRSAAVAARPSSRLRYPDRSVVIDLSHQPHEEKIQYIRALLPALDVDAAPDRTAAPRVARRGALFSARCRVASELLDLTFNGYTIVTYRASRLPKELLAASEVMIVTRESSAVEAESFRQLCASVRARR